MTDEQFAYAKTFMTRIVMEKIPQAKRWSVAKEFKSWLDNLPKEQFQSYLERLRLLTATLSDDAPTGGEMSRESGHFILFETYPPGESEKRERLYRIGGEATAYYALALWRSLEVEELRQTLKG